MRRPTPRHVLTDRALELLPLFRLSDSAADEGALQYVPAPGTRWRVLPSPGDRLPGTFDQDVWIGLLHRWAEAGEPADGAITFRLHAFLRSLGRKADGRTYEQLRASLTRLERTTLESSGAYLPAGSGAAVPIGAAPASTGPTSAGSTSAGSTAAGSASADPGAAPATIPATTLPGGAAVDVRFTLLASVVIERRRQEDHEQLLLFDSLAAHEPGDARVVLSPTVRANLSAGLVARLSWTRYQQLGSPVARRLYRLLAALAPTLPDGRWRVPLERWAEQLPLTQRYPSHLQRVLQPAHEMLVEAGAVRAAAFAQEGREWWAQYEL